MKQGLRPSVFILYTDRESEARCWEATRELAKLEFKPSILIFI